MGAEATSFEAPNTIQANNENDEFSTEHSRSRYKRRSPVSQICPRPKSHVAMQAERATEAQDVF